jgi:hypothetical protein
MSEPMRPVVFLDMDDVLCLNQEHNSVQMMTCFRESRLDWPELWCGLVDAGAAANLHSLHKEFAPLYVVSTSWATYLNRAQMCDVFHRTQLQFVIENLHQEWVTPRARSSSRRDEIDWWLEEFRTGAQPFIVLDDTASGWSLAHSPLTLDGHVVLCDVGSGFTLEKLEEARQRLHRQLRKGLQAPAPGEGP